MYLGYWHLNRTDELKNEMLRVLLPDLVFSMYDVSVSPMWNKESKFEY